MAEHKLNIEEGTSAQDQAGAPTDVPRFEYRVTGKTVRKDTKESNGSEGLFKNGRLYKPGDIVELTEKSAEAYIALGEVEPVNTTEDKN